MILGKSFLESTVKTIKRFLTKATSISSPRT